MDIILREREREGDLVEYAQVEWRRVAIIEWERVKSAWHDHFKQNKFVALPTKWESVFNEN